MNCQMDYVVRDNKKSLWIITYFYIIWMTLQVIVKKSHLVILRTLKEKQTIDNSLCILTNNDMSLQYS